MNIFTPLKDQRIIVYLLKNEISKVWKILVLVSLFTSSYAFSQVGIGTNTPASSAVLDLTSVDGALLLPRVKSQSNVNKPINGMMIYNIRENCIMGYANGLWDCLTKRYPIDPELEGVVIAGNTWLNYSELSGEHLIEENLITVTSSSVEGLDNSFDVSSHCKMRMKNGGFVISKPKNIVIKFSKPVTNVKLRSTLNLSESYEVTVNSPTGKPELKIFGVCQDKVRIDQNLVTAVNFKDNFIISDINIGGDWFTEMTITAKSGIMSFLVSYIGASVL